MSEQILSQVQAWGFPCSQDDKGNWLIFPKKETECWQLIQAEEQWQLLVDKIPQINLHLDEVLVFLKRRLI